MKYTYVKYIPQFFFRLAEKKSIIDYLLLDPAERLRTNIMHVPSAYKSSVIRAPVPWKQSKVVAQQYCRHNLFITNPIIVRIRVTWEKRYRWIISIRYLAGFVTKVQLTL